MERLMMGVRIPTLIDIKEIHAASYKDHAMGKRQEPRRAPVAILSITARTPCLASMLLLAEPLSKSTPQRAEKVIGRRVGCGIERRSESANAG
jgi:hypothetical protein